jgi:hypothetical protein
VLQAGVTDPVLVNLLIAPVYAVSALSIVGFSYGSDRTRTRAPWVALPAMVNAVAFALLAGGNKLGSFPLQYAAMFMTCAGSCIIPLLLAWLAEMVRGRTRTAVATALVVGPSPQPRAQLEVCACVFVSANAAPIGWVSKITSHWLRSIVTVVVADARGMGRASGGQSEWLCGPQDL